MPAIPVPGCCNAPRSHLLLIAIIILQVAWCLVMLEKSLLLLIKSESCNATGERKAGVSITCVLRSSPGLLRLCTLLIGIYRKYTSFEYRMKRLSLYWKCQLTGWSAASLYWAYTGWRGQGFLWSLGILYFVTDIILYILLTHAYRNVVLRQGWHRLPLQQLLPRIIFADLLLAFAFMITTIGKIYLLREWVTGFVPPFPVFFQENWLVVLIAGFRLMTIWVLAYHLYHYAQREITIAKENARLEVISKDAQLNNLSAQLNPHFFFNSLNNIKSLIIENPTAARRAVDLLADLLRSSLYSRDRMLVTLAEELELVKDYLELEKLRLEERLQAQLSIDEALLDQQVPRLCIQTLVENAIKHGGGTIGMEISRKGEYIVVQVQNPGGLDTGRSSTGLGLKNLRERIQLQYPGRGVFDIKAHSDGIILATLLIPCV